MDESYFGGRKGNGAGELRGKTPCSVSWNTGEKSGQTLSRMSPVKTLLTMAIKKVKRGSLIYTDKFRCNNGLISCGFLHMRINHWKRFVNGKVYTTVSGVSGHLLNNG